MTIFDGAKIEVKFDGVCLKSEQTTFHHGNIGNVCITNKINLSSNDPDSKFKLLNSSFGAVKLTKKIQILISILILNMALNLMYVELFHCHITLVLVKV